ncbi:transcriptional regulator, AraC family [Pedobacter hartonius]|uniref:Transcriptional regulator, AraC family n=2 Tax=Pedobacter hartonius TaxID=425514 RepID=A0A1H4HIQ5_9SPHI|nr:transcriptional regulator, AraC family [Pedobacter hartonius]
MLSLREPLHPLVSVVRIADIRVADDAVWQHFSLNFYCISLKRNVAGKMKYGQKYYDYDKGIMTFVAPNQVFSFDSPPVYDTGPSAGYALFFHPDFLYRHPMVSKIKNYGFFSYALNEALHLSEKEEIDIEDIFLKIDEQLHHIDKHTQDIVLSQIDLLLNLSNRFYGRQFITRKMVNHDVLAKMEQLLETYFAGEETSKNGLPSVEYFAGQLNLSPHYLSDLLRSFTGQSAQQHLQSKLINKAKEYLSVTNLSVAEIAYNLGFEYPQSFNKLFKKKTSQSPLQFRQKFK